MNHDPKLEARIQREFDNLPEIPAPPTLAPRVLRAIQAQRTRPWWQQSWSAWPPQIQTAALALLITLAMALSLAGGWAAWGGTRPHIETDWLTAWVPFGDALLAVANTTLLLIRHTGQTWLVIGLTTVSLMYLTCIGVGSLCLRLVIPKR
jgi:hypothetical protein